MVTVSIDGLEFGYKSNPVFSGITFKIESGEVLSIVGRNGAGKSTLLKCINHLLKPTRGNVAIGAHRIEKMGLIERARHFGYLSQKSESLFPSTVFDTVLGGRYPHSPVRFNRRDEELTAEALAMLELDAFAGRSFNQLSGGEQQQVLIARALVQGADILLFDEPTNNLDLRHQLQIMRLIRSISRERKIASVIAIHDLNLAAAFSEKIIVMHDGAIFAAGRPAEVLSKATLKKVFSVDVTIYEHGGVPHIVMVDTCGHDGSD